MLECTGISVGGASARGGGARTSAPRPRMAAARQRAGMPRRRTLVGRAGAHDAVGKQLVELAAAHKLGWDIKEVDDRLAQLALLLPDMVLLPGLGMLTPEAAQGVQHAQADVLVALIQDLPALAVRLLNLRERLPALNISALVARWPSLVLDFDVPAFNARAQLMREQLPGVDLEQLIGREPALLKADLPAALDHMRLVYPDMDPVLVLASQPQLVATLAEMASAQGLPGLARSSGFWYYDGLEE